MVGSHPTFITFENSKQMSSSYIRVWGVRTNHPPPLEKEQHMHPVYGCRYTREARHGGPEQIKHGLCQNSPDSVTGLFYSGLRSQIPGTIT